MKNKKGLRIVTMLLAVILCVTAFSTVAYAGGGDYYDDELPPETAVPEESEPAPTVEPGEPFTEDGIAKTRDLLFDKNTNKQFITVETRNGKILYIVIDYDKPTDEDGEQYHTYFLNPVDEADLLALLEDEDGNTPISCNCTEKCAAGAVNTDCPLCSKDMTNCAGKEAVPADEPEETEPPEEEPKNGGMGGILVLVLILAAGGGAALWYFKFRKPKASAKGDTELDEFEFDDEDDGEDFGVYDDSGDADAAEEEQEDSE